MRETEYYRIIANRIKEISPEIDIVKLDPVLYQGIPDYLILYKNKHAFLEIKISERAGRRPNQEYYVNLFNERSGFSRFIYPENEDQVINDLAKFLLE